MTPLQYHRWLGFSLRMATRAIDATPERRAKIAHSVAAIVGDLETDAAGIVDWDHGAVCAGDRVCEALDGEHYHERLSKGGRCSPFGNRFHGQVECCIRAGLDVASSPSVGVIGFTVGDLRRMYPGELPGWLQASFATPIADADDSMRVRL